jgi:hypothetical protein
MQEHETTYASLNHCLHYDHYYHHHHQFIVTQQREVVVTFLRSVQRDCNSITVGFHGLFYCEWL